MRTLNYFSCLKPQRENDFFDIFHRLSGNTIAESDQGTACNADFLLVRSISMLELLVFESSSLFKLIDNKRIFNFLLQIPGAEDSVS